MVSCYLEHEQDVCFQNNLKTSSHSIGIMLTRFICASQFRSNSDSDRRRSHVFKMWLSDRQFLSKLLQPKTGFQSKGSDAKDQILPKDKLEVPIGSLIRFEIKRIQKNLIEMILTI